MSFLEEDNKPKIHVKDILFTILRNLHWLILCAAIVGVGAAWHVRHQNRVYASYARVLIKGSSTGSNAESSIREASIKNMYTTRSLYNSSINNEIMIFTSKTAITEVAKNLKLNIDYTTNTRLVNRVKNLYGESPIEVIFIDDNEDDYIQLTVTPRSNTRVLISMPGYNDIYARIGDTSATPFGRVVVNKTWFYTPAQFNIPITVTHNSLNAIVDHYRYALQVVRDNDYNTIVNISLNDASPTRAADVINEAIRVYNEDAIKDKQRIIAYT